MAARMNGLAAAPGLARGPALRWEQQPLTIPVYTPTDLSAERTRLAGARRTAAEQLRQLSRQIETGVGEAEAALFEAQAMFLEDATLVQRAEDEIAKGQNAEIAWHEACEYFAAMLESMPDETLSARSADIRDIDRRVIETLTGSRATVILVEPVVILAHDLLPSQTALLDRSKVLAFCTAEGGRTSHTAILAKALGIPAVVGLGEAVLRVQNDTVLLVDGNEGWVVADPDPEAILEFDQLARAAAEQRSRDKALAEEPAMTRDGHRVEIVANVGSVEDTRLALQYGAEGIGLLRTEFLFLNRGQAPDEQTQYAAYRTILELMGSRPAVVRTLDIGGDKDVPYFDFGAEANPFLGYRAVRISLDHPKEFKVQLRALLRAGAGHDLRIMFPMIATLDEVRAVKRLTAEARDSLLNEGQEAAGTIQVGIMVEVPSVVLMVERFAREVDFFSVGTNDLTQYIFAAERGNARVAQFSDPCHPAVLRAIRQVVEGAHQAGIWVGVCGEMGGDPQAIPILLGLGVDELSITPLQIPSAKQIVRQWSLAEARDLAARALELDDASAVRNLARRSASASSTGISAV